jgi:uncharacterized membrane protein (DUF4010 family)
MCERGGRVPWVLLAALLPVSGLLFAGYSLVSRAQDGTFGLTTEIAAVAVFLLGAMIMLGHRELAIGLGAVTATALAYKQPLHGPAGSRRAAPAVPCACRYLFSRLAPGSDGVTVV